MTTEAEDLTFDDPVAHERVTLTAGEPGKSLNEASQRVVKSSGWATEGEAAEAGGRWFDAAMMAFARLRIGADFGRRAAKGMFTSAGLAMLEAEHGVRFLNDEHGLMTFTSDPPPRFARATVSAVRGVPQDRLTEAMTEAAALRRALSEKERFAHELFFDSFFVQSEDARFVLLVMAIEALLEPQPRSAEAQAHVEQLRALTCGAASLPEAERASLLSSLGWLMTQSIGQTGRNLAERLLGSTIYDKRQPGAFFSYVYGLRSRLVHGTPPLPSREEISTVSGPLELFVSDLLWAAARLPAGAYGPKAV